MVYSRLHSNLVYPVAIEVLAIYWVTHAALKGIHMLALHGLICMTSSFGDVHVHHPNIYTILGSLCMGQGICIHMHRPYVYT